MVCLTLINVYHNPIFTEPINLDKRLWIMQLKETENIAVPTDNFQVCNYPVVSHVQISITITFYQHIRLPQCVGIHVDT